MSHRLLTRRRMLGSTATVVGGALVWGGLRSRRAHADTTSIEDIKRIVYVNFDGGWDTLMSLDPRDHNDFGDPAGSIYTGYEILAANDADTNTLMNSGDGSGLIQPAGSNIAFGPAIGTLADRYADLCVVRGMDMGTVTHEVGRRYALTGKFPSGLNANGSDIGTVVAGQAPDASPLPNLVVGGVETYNSGFDPKASGVVVTAASDLGFVLKAVNAQYALDAESQSALAAYVDSVDCLSDQLDSDGKVAAYRASWDKSQVLMDGSLFTHFDFKPNPPAGSTLDALYQTFGITNLNQDLAGPKGQGLIAAQAITEDIAQAVSIQPSPRMDHHSEDWEDLHLPGQRDGFEVVAALIDWLESRPHPKGGSYFDHTIIVCTSDFARTPTVNVRKGRDHHLASSCLVTGGGIAGNRVIGATTDDTYGVQPVDLQTGLVDPNGHLLRPSDVHATIYEALGLSYDHLDNQSPKVIEAMLA